jgi:glutathione S-transferase
MLTLFHHPLCPRSRYVHLIFGEYGIPARLVKNGFGSAERISAAQPSRRLPVLVTEGQPPIPGATVIAEYVEKPIRRADRIACCLIWQGAGLKCGGSQIGSTT